MLASCASGPTICFRDRTQHTLWMTLRTFIPGAQGTRETLCWNKCSTKWRWVQSRVFTVTPIAPLSPAVAQFPIALLSVRQLAGILHAITAAPLILKCGRGVFPPNCPRPSPDARPPSIPKGAVAGL